MNKIIAILKKYNPSKWEILSFLLIPIFLGLLNSSCTNDDIWFFLSIGKYILNNGFFHIDPFTIHEGLNVVVQQWSFDIAIYLINNYTGIVGLYIFTNIMNILTIIAIYKLLMLVTDNKRNISVITTTIIGSLYSIMFLTLRPQIISTPLLILELYFLEKYFKTNNKKNLIVLPILSLLMINTQAAIWPMLLCIIIPFILNTFNFKIGKIESSKRDIKPLIITLILMILIAIINPYGIDALLYLKNSFGIEAINEVVPEMESVNINLSYGKMVFIIVISVYMAFIIKKDKIQLRYILMLLGTSYLAFSSNRGILFFIITSIYPIAIYKNNKKNYNKETNNNGILIFAITSIIIVLLPFTILVKTKQISIRNNIEEHIDHIYKQEKGNLDNVRLYCPYAVCTYAEYIGIKPYIDSRAEVFSIKNNKKSDIINEYYYLQKNQLYYKDFLNKYDFNYLIVFKTDTLYLQLLHDDNYEIIYKKEKQPSNKLKYKIVKDKFENETCYVFKKISQ